MTVHQVECHCCGDIVDADKCTAETIEVATGRAGGSWSFGLRWGIFGKIGKTSGKGIRYNTGRKYFKNETVYTCPNCIALRERKKSRRRLVWLTLFTITVVAGMLSPKDKVDTASANLVPARNNLQHDTAKSVQPTYPTNRVASLNAESVMNNRDKASNSVTPEVVAEEWAKCQAVRDWTCAEEKARILLMLQPNDLDVQKLGQRTALSKSLHGCIASQDLVCIETEGNKLLAIEPTNVWLKDMLIKISQKRDLTKR